MSLIGAALILISLNADGAPGPRRAACEAIPELQAEIELTVRTLDGKPTPGVIAIDPEAVLAELIADHQGELEVLLAQFLGYRAALAERIDRTSIEGDREFERARGMSLWLIGRLAEGMERSSVAQVLVGCLNVGSEQLTKDALKLLGGLIHNKGDADLSPLDAVLRSQECCPEPLLKSLLEHFPVQTVRYFAELEKVDTATIADMCDRVEFVHVRAGQMLPPQTVFDALGSLMSEGRWYTDRFVVEVMQKSRYFRTPELIGALSQDEHRFVKPAVEELLRMEEEAVRQDAEAAAENQGGATKPR